MIDNNANFGFTLQNVICNLYGLVPETAEARKQFSAATDPLYVKTAKKIAGGIFAQLCSFPIRCTTFSKSIDGDDIPYNFVLADNSTLSIRTNKKGYKVAPRRVGQAGFEKLNRYFSSIYGKEIKDQEDIKSLIYEKIEEVLPIFFENLFDADYILWIYFEKKQIKSHLIKGDAGVNIDYVKNKFSFTKTLYEWNESTTLKYEGISIAEIQVHKNRTFKFRFLMNNVLKLLIQKDKNNETFGITAEKVICDKFHLDYPKSFLKRYSPDLQKEIDPIIRKAFMELPRAVKHTGSDKGERGGDSKCSYDFMLEHNQTLSLKTNTGKMVCPPEVGQPGADTCYLYFGKFVSENYIDNVNFKQMVFTNIDSILPIYLNHLFDSDYLLWVFKKNGKYDFKVLNKNYASDFKWIKQNFSFTKTKIEEWNESNTLKYNGVSIGEFQVHKNRDCYKFRFNLENLIKVVGVCAYEE